MKNKKYFILYANCVPVKGAIRSCLCDLQRGEIKFIPNLLYDILIQGRKYSIDDLKSLFNNEHNDGMDAYFSLLQKEEWGFYTDEPEKFPELDMKWEVPYSITNAILDLNVCWIEHFPFIIKQLEELGCQAIQIRVYDAISNDTIQKLLESLAVSRICSIEMILKYDEEKDEDSLLLMRRNQRRINSIILHSSPFNRVISKEYITFYYTENNIDSHFQCGQINRSSFNLNTEMFIESKYHNSCLNQKISVDNKGEIRNCPSMPESFGNVKNSLLKDALRKESFKKYWFLTKDSITTCKDCEFRYICMDCRAFVENPVDVYSKPLKCGYNPYTTEWEDWSQNPIKQRTMESYNISV
jgi:SPASM domain peptide maturase of grasp-with-spasm system